MGTSPDVGGRGGLGKPLVPDYHELETTAQTQNFKLGLGIVPNTLDVSFTKLGGEIWKYQASPSKPSVPMDVLKGIQRPLPEMKSSLEEEHFQSILDDLPTNLGNELKRQQKFPYSQRDSSYVAFEEVLRFAAKALAWLEESEKIDPSAHAERSSTLRQIPKALFHRWIILAEASIKELQILEKTLPDRTLSAICSDNLKWLTKLLNHAKSITQEEDEKTIKKALRVLYLETSELNQAYRQGKLSTALQWTGALLHALLTPVAALSLTIKSNSLIFALQHGVGPLGDPLNSKREFSEGFQKLSEILKGLLDKNEAIYHPYITSSTHFLILAFVSLVTEAGGISFAASQEEKASKRQRLFEARSLAFTLATSLITSAHTLPTLSSLLLAAFPLGKNNQEIFEQSSISMALNSLLLAAGKGDKAVKRITPVILGMKSALTTALMDAKKIISKQELSTEKGREFGIWIRQSLLAIQKGNPKGYLEPTHEWLENQDIKKEQIQTECETVVELCVLMLANCHKLDQLTNFTSVVSQAA